MLIVDDAAMEHRALEQVAEARGGALFVERGWESTTQERLIERGLLWAKPCRHNGKPALKLMLSRNGQAALCGGHQT